MVAWYLMDDEEERSAFERQEARAVQDRLTAIIGGGGEYLGDVIIQGPTERFIIVDIRVMRRILAESVCQGKVPETARDARAAVVSLFRRAVLRATVPPRRDRRETRREWLWGDFPNIPALARSIATTHRRRIDSL